jgi:hypothetical protein
MIAQLDRGYVKASGPRTLVRLASYLAFEGRPAAAKGQFVNPLVLAHLRAAARRPAARKVDRPVFVIGMGRSGTTVLGLVLGTHRDVGFLNEPKALWNVIRGDEDIIGTYAPTPGRLRLCSIDADAGARQRAQSLYSWYLGVTRSRRVVDKYPELIFRTEFVRGLFPDAQLVAITRRPWPTIASVGRWTGTPSDVDADWWGVNDRKWQILWKEGVEGETANSDLAELDLGAQTDSHVRAAVEWIVTMRAALTLDAEEHHLKIISYEKLTEAPAATVGTLLEWLGLERRNATIEYAANVLRPGQCSEPMSLVKPLRDLIDATERRLREYA